MSDKTGAAFPHIAHDENQNPIGQYAGLTKREWYAGLAMQGLLADQQGHNATNEKGVAKLAVEQADALLAELAKRGEGHG